jgi:soluble P-type ATPase
LLTLKKYQEVASIPVGSNAISIIALNGVDIGFTYLKQHGSSAKTLKNGPFLVTNVTNFV